MSHIVIEPTDQDPELLDPTNIVPDHRNYIAFTGEDNNDGLESLPLLKQTKSPSAWWIIVPAFVTSTCLTMGMAPIIQFYTQVFCNEYYQNKGAITNITATDDIPFEKCQIPEIQALVSNTQAIINITASVGALLVTGYYGALSDRMGRKFVLRITTFGSLLDMLMMILTQRFQNVIGIRLLYVAPAIKGLSGGWTTIMAANQAYLADCTEPANRVVMFGRLTAMFFLGGVVGPSLGSFILKSYGETQIINIFYLIFFIEFLYLLYIHFILPESNHRFRKSTQQLLPKQPLRERLNIFSALGIFFRPNAYNTQATAHSLPIIALVHFLFILGLPFSLFILYAMYQFKWTAYESGIFFSVLSAARIVVLLGLLPLLNKWFKGERGASTRRGEYEEVAGEEPENQEMVERKRQKQLRDLKFDVWAVRLGCAFETVALILYGVAPNTIAYFGATVVGSMGSIASPSLRSFFTNLVPPTQAGELFGAVSVLDAIAGILNPLIMNPIYSATVKTMPNLVFFFGSALVAIAIALTLFVGPSNKNKASL